MKTKRQKIEQQIELQEKIQSAGFNVVECCSCGSVILHECNDDEEIDCYACDIIMSKSDCPDLFYTGLELSEMFNE